MNIKIKRNIICTLFFIMTFFALNKVLAKDLLYQAAFDKESRLTYANYVKAVEAGDGIAKQKDEDITNNTGRADISYQTCGIIFHKNYASTYTDDLNKISGAKKYNGKYSEIDGNQYKQINFDMINSGIALDAQSGWAGFTSVNQVFGGPYADKVHYGSTFLRLSDKSMDSSNAIFIIDKNNNYLDGRDTLKNIYSLTSDYHTANRFSIGKETVKQLKNRLKESNIKVEKGNYRVKFSNIIHMGDKTVDTAEAFFKYIVRNGEDYWDSRNFGIRNESYSPGDSALNQFDNEMLIPAVNSRCIYVQHQIIDATNKEGFYRYDVNNAVAIQNPGSNEENIYNELSSRLGSGWGEKYSSDSSIKVLNVENKLNENITSDEKYRICGYTIFKVNENGDPIGNPIVEVSGDVYGEVASNIWIDSEYKDVIIGAADNQQEQNYGVIYIYEKTKEIHEDKTLLVGHVKYDSSLETANFYALKNNSLKFLKGSEKVTGEYFSLTNEDDWLSKYSFNTERLNVEKSNSSLYKCVGYKTIYGNTINEIKANIQKASYVRNSNPVLSASKKYSMIIFFYDTDGGVPGEGENNPNLAELPIKGWLDFINTKDSTYKNATNMEYEDDKNYKKNSSMSIQADFKSNADLVPSYGELRAYVRTAPFYIKGIEIKKEEKIEYVEKRLQISAEYQQARTDVTDINGGTMYYTIAHRQIVTVSVPVKYTIYTIPKCTIGLLDNFELYDKDTDNIGGKLFDPKVIKEEVVVKSTNSSLNNMSRSGGNGKFTDLTVCNRNGERLSSENIMVASGLGSENEAKNAVENYINGLYPSSFVYRISDEQISIGNGFKNIFDTKEKKGTIDSIGNYRIIWNGNTKTVGSYEKINSEYSDDYFKSKVKSYINWDNLRDMTKYSDFEEKYFGLGNYIRENGIRELSGKVNYKIIGNSGKYKPTYYISSIGFTSNSGNKEIDFNKNTQSITLNNKDKNNLRVRKVDVYTPIQFGDWSNIIKTDTTFDSSIGENGAGKSLVLQADTEFSITPKFNSFGGNGYSGMETQQNVDYCYVIFNFKVKKIDDGVEYEAGKKIKINANESTKFKTTHDYYSLRDKDNNVRIIAVAKNKTSKLEEYYDKEVSIDINNLSLTNIFISNKKNELVTITSTNQQEYLSNDGILGSSNHAVTSSLLDRGKVKGLSRIYDFAVTDCNDPAFKDVFKKIEGNKVNAKTEKVYWSGMKYLNVSDEGSNQINAGVSRTVFGEGMPGVGSNPTRILPLGPYKNTNSTYTKAPKLGYRISFDLKTTGKLDNYDNRKIIIVPRYYYVSKDVKSNGEPVKFVEPNNLKLYYKNFLGLYSELKTYKSSNKNGGDIQSRYENTTGKTYSIYYKPNDGYRFLRNEDVTDDSTNLSNKNVKVDISKLTLTKSMMTTNNSYIQAWYGEFKLPNSTIAVEQKDGKYNVNEPLTNGYIGVIFDIYCQDTDGYTLLYSQNSRNDDGAEIDNASQWDYEGYLGIPEAGKKIEQNLKIQLEKGIWEINNDMYQKIKGTVLLYDIDERAANDYN